MEELTKQQEDFVLEEGRELKADLYKDTLTNCCGVPFIENSDVCSDCKEHAGDLK